MATQKGERQSSGLSPSVTRWGVWRRALQLRRGIGDIPAVVADSCVTTIFEAPQPVPWAGGLGKL